MTTLLIIVHVLVCLFLICIVMLQHGKGADIGASFGGSSQTLLGAEGAVPLLNKITTLAAIIFMGTSISLAYISANKSTASVMKEVEQAQHSQQPQSAPVEPAVIPMPSSDPAATEPAATDEQASESTGPAASASDVVEPVEEPATEEQPQQQ
jgi:preprotein translocase subunit SecG